jgi:hypothetical protein
MNDVGQALPAGIFDSTEIGGHSLPYRTWDLLLVFGKHTVKTATFAV